MTWRAMGLADVARHVIGCHLHPVSAFEKKAVKALHMIGQERTGILSTNHMSAYSASVSKKETGLSQE